MRSLAGSTNIPDQCRLCDSAGLTTNYPSGLSRVIMRRLTALLPPTLTRPFEFAALRKLPDHPTCPTCREGILSRMTVAVFVFHVALGTAPNGPSVLPRLLFPALLHFPER